MFRANLKQIGNFSKLSNVKFVRLIQSGGNGDADENAKHYDIIIAGGGMVGTTLACSLGNNSTLKEKNILLLEGGPKFKGFDGGEYRNRVSALNPLSISLFKSIGAWESIASVRHKPVKQFQVWDASTQAMITFNHDNFSDDIAYIIENDLVLHAVTEKLHETPSVEVRYQARIEEVQLPGDESNKSQVTLKDNSKISCDLLDPAEILITEFL